MTRKEINTLYKYNFIPQRLIKGFRLALGHHPFLEPGVFNCYSALSNVLLTISIGANLGVYLLYLNDKFLPDEHKLLTSILIFHTILTIFFAAIWIVFRFYISPNYFAKRLVQLAKLLKKSVKELLAAEDQLVELALALLVSKAAAVKYGERTFDIDSKTAVALRKEFKHVHLICWSFSLAVIKHNTYYDRAEGVIIPEAEQARIHKLAATLGEAKSIEAKTPQEAGHRIP